MNWFTIAGWLGAAVASWVYCSLIVKTVGLKAALRENHPNPAAGRARGLK